MYVYLVQICFSFLLMFAIYTLSPEQPAADPINPEIIQNMDTHHE
jgi:hypothetical protein